MSIDGEKLRALLRLLSRGEAQFETASRRVLRVDDGTALKRHSVNLPVLTYALDEGYVAVSGMSLMLTAAGRMRLEAHEGPVFPPSPETGRGDRRAACTDHGAAPLVDAAESPLAWLYRRRGASGKGVISEAEFRAGERLRADFTKAGLMPSVTTNWRAMAAPGGGGMSRAELTDYALAARARVQSALAAIGPELADAALDVCCFLKGLEQVESEHAWPQRSAKVVLLLALRALARHYGIGEEAKGRSAASELRHWGTPDYRPAVHEARSD